MERWLPVVGFEGIYEVSDGGRVRSVDRVDARGHKRTGRLRTIQVGKGDGYPILRLSRDRRAFFRKVHHLVAEAFLGPPPLPIGMGPGTCEINHKNGVKTDNRSGNLEYCTRGQNAEHAQATGLSASKQGTRNGRARLADSEVIEIRRLHGLGMSQQALATKYGISTSTVNYMVRRITWAHL